MMMPRTYGSLLSATRVQQDLLLHLLLGEYHSSELAGVLVVARWREPFHGSVRSEQDARNRVSDMAKR